MLPLYATEIKFITKITNTSWDN